jgi:acetolactate synthase-1/2/3 large subunit
MFSNPTACHHASEKHRLPVLTIIANNARWNAVDATARLVYPKGFMAEQQWMATSDLRPSPAYERLVEASGGYGVKVSTRGELEAALRRALTVVEQERRQAVVNVLCA